MKKLIVLGMLGILGWIPYQASAQISVSLNIGSQPLWGPVGYDYVDNYYLPDVECYYNVPTRRFIYMDNNRWIHSASLPSRYRGYDLYSGYKVVVNSRDPYRNFDRDRVTYARYRSMRGQQVIRYSNDSRYYVVKGHPHGMPSRPSRNDYSRVRENNWNRGGDHGRRDNDNRGNDRGHDSGGRGERGDRGGHGDRGRH